MMTRQVIGQVLQENGRVINWDVPDFFLIQKRKWVHSHTFSFYGCMWYLEMVCDKTVYAALTRELKDSGPNSIKVIFTVGIKKVEEGIEAIKVPVNHTFERGSSVGFHLCKCINELEMQKSDFVPSGMLTITCSFLRSDAPQSPMKVNTQQLRNLSPEDELNTLKEELEEDQSNISELEVGTDNLLEENSSNKNELEELKKLNNELKEKIDKIEAENLLYKLRYDVIKSELDEAKLTISKQKNNTVTSEPKVNIGETIREEESTAASCFKSLSEDLSNLLEAENLEPDIILTCDDHKVRAHKVILSTQSEVFATMLLNDKMAENSTQVVEIQHMDPAAVDHFVEYFYTRRLPVNLTVDLARCLYELGKKYIVTDLVSSCTCFLEENVDPENACKLFDLADAYSDRKLGEIAVTYILKNKVHLQGNQWLAFCKYRLLNHFSMLQAYWAPTHLFLIFTMCIFLSLSYFFSCVDD